MAVAGDSFGYAYSCHFHPQTVREGRRSEPPRSTAVASARSTTVYQPETTRPSLSAACVHRGVATQFAGAAPAPTQMANRIGHRGLCTQIAGIPAAASAAAGTARPSPRTSVGSASGPVPSVVPEMASLAQGGRNAMPGTALQMPHQQHVPGTTMTLPAPVLSMEPPQVFRGPTTPALPARGGEEAFGAAFDGDAQDAQRAADYAADIVARLFDDETTRGAKPNYMDSQGDINAKMRAILVDWLVEVHMKYKMRWETLFLAINIIDRYLSVRSIMRKKLQLLGVVALFIASKYEEIDPPKATEFSYITDHTYPKKDILNFEARVLSALDFRVAAPTPAHFVDRWQRVNGSDAVQKALSQYILELALMDVRSLRHPPSALASASILLSNDILRRRPTWPAAMAHHTRRSEAALRPCMEDLRSMLESAGKSQLQVVQRKYRLEQNLAVANLVHSGARD